MMRQVRVSCFAAFVLTVSTLSAFGQTKPPSEGSLGDSVWYDADAQKTIPIELRDETDDSVNRESRWLPKPKRLPQRSSPNAAGGTTGGGGMFGTGITLGNLFGWTLAIALVAALIAAFVYAVSTVSFDGGSGPASRRRHGGDAGLDRQTLERVKHLPAELRRTDVNMRDEAERLMNVGRFDQAIILLLGHQLLLLDRAGYLRLNRSKTNGRYVRETRNSDRESGDRLRATADSFERSYFGRHEITGTEFQQLWQWNTDLETHLAAAEGVAA